MLAPEDEAVALEALRYSFASDIVELVVLTADDIFLQTLREAVGVSRRLWHVPTADKVGDLLVAGSVGILVLDAQAPLPEAVPVYIAKIKRQFPDLVIIVAGARDSENALATLISAGTVYRFIHKPMSPGRARLFTDAAVKKYEEQRRTGGSTISATSVRTPRGMLIGGTCAALGVLTAIIVGLTRHNTHEEGGVQPSLHAAAPAPAPADDHEQLMARAENALREQLAKSLEQRRGHAAPARPQSAPAPDESPRAAEGADASNVTAPEVQAPQATAQAPPQAADHPPPQAPNEAQHPADAKPAERPLKSSDDRLQQDRLIAPANDGALAQQKPAPRVLNASELTLVKSVRPAYPRRAEQKGIEGWVDLEFTVAESGAVQDIDVRAAVPSGVFEQATIGALSQWRYQPVVRDAKPTAVRARIRIRFALAH